MSIDLPCPRCRQPIRFGFWRFRVHLGSDGTCTACGCSWRTSRQARLNGVTWMVAFRAQ